MNNQSSKRCNEGCLELNSESGGHGLDFRTFAGEGLSALTRPMSGRDASKWLVMGSGDE